MSKIKFHKIVASGNDFLVIDNRKKVIKDGKKFTAEVCRPHLGVGADGVLLVEPSKKADFFMRIINADGSEAEACGNGYRCVALYAQKFMGVAKKMSFETLAGVIDGQILKANGNTARVRVKMANPSGYEKKISLPINGRKLDMAFINTGVPHVLIFTEDVSQVNARELGRILRYHEHFQPKGTNVNFVEVTGPKSLSIRTYERGVEDETLACGTGSVAAALVSILTGRVQGPVQVKPKSGEILTIDAEISGNQIRNVYLEGNADIVFSGELGA